MNFKIHWKNEIHNLFKEDDIELITKTVRKQAEEYGIAISLVLQNEKGDMLSIDIGGEYSYADAKVNVYSYVMIDESLNIPSFEFSIQGSYSGVESPTVVNYIDAENDMFKFVRSEDFIDTSR